MKLIVGLGNPGNKYQKTRHNVGWLVVDKLIENLRKYDDGLKWNESRNAKAEYAKTIVGQKKIELLKPQTYMNRSGFSVAYAVRKHNMDISSDLIIVHDDKDIDLGEVKVQNNRSSAGHNGVKSIIENLGTQDFYRIRVGVRNSKTEKMDTANFVLKKFGFFEKNKLNQSIELAVEEIFKLI